MTTVATNVSARKKGFFKTWFFSLLQKHLPRRFKRLIYVSSICGLIQQMKDPDELLIDKLNQTLHLAHYPDSMAFPMHIRSVIWRDSLLGVVTLHGHESVQISDLVNCELSNKDYATVGEYFATRSPEWLRYGAVELMTSDVILLLKQIRLFNSDSKTAVR